MRAPTFPSDCRLLLIRPWLDSTVDDIGHDPRSLYVERYWLGILGPTVTWFLRYVSDRFDEAPDGFDLDVAACARTLGLGDYQGRGAALPRTVARCCQFDTAKMMNPATLAVRRKLPPLSERQLDRLPEALRHQHPVTTGHDFGDVGEVQEPETLVPQARRLALSLIQLGEGKDGIERQMQRWRFPDETAREAIVWAYGHRARLAAQAVRTA